MLIGKLSYEFDQRQRAHLFSPAMGRNLAAAGNRLRRPLKNHETLIFAFAGHRHKADRQNRLTFHLVTMLSNKIELLLI